MSKYKFNGQIVGDSFFRLSQWVFYPNLFLPLLHCRLEQTSSGCLVFVECSLFFSTWLLMFTGLLFLPAAALYFLLIQQAWYYVVIILIAKVLFYLPYLATITCKNKSA